VTGTTDEFDSIDVVRRFGEGLLERNCGPWRSGASGAGGSSEEKVE